MTKTERSFFNAAKAVSTLSNHKHKLGCVIVKGHKIISSSCNSATKCSSIQAKMDKDMFGEESRGALHAEVDALLPLMRRGEDLTNASIYVYREHKNGVLACARPCSRCEKLIKQCGIKRIHFTIENGIAEEKW